MKKFVTIMSIGFLILFSAISISVFSSCGKKGTKTEDEEKYKMTEEDALANLNFSFVLTTIDGVEGYSVFRLKRSSRTELTIPDTFMGKPVLSISESAFRGSSIVKITIGSNVRVIGVLAFEDCGLLTNVTFSGTSKLETIERYAFFNCDALSNFVIPKSTKTIGESAFAGNGVMHLEFESGMQLETIGESAFRGNGLIQEITIPRTVTTIGDYAFNGCQSLVSVAYETGSELTTIGRWAFYGCESLASITIPATVTTIGVQAFEYCLSLATVIFESGSQLETIGTSAFASCYSLSSITIPASVKTIDSYSFEFDSLETVTFESGSQLETIGKNAFYANISEGISNPFISITIPASVITIGDAAFSGCNSLETVIFEEGSQLETIGNQVFSGCSALSSITIPASVTTIGYQVFSGCSSLETINIEENGNFIFEDGCLFSKTLDKLVLLLDFVDQLGAVEIPASVVTIQSRAFYDFENILTVTFESGSQLETIGDFAFFGTSLTSITIPASVTTIGDHAFYHCTSLVTVTFESGSQLETIGYYALGLVGSPPATGQSHSITILGDLTNVTNILEIIFDRSNRWAYESFVTLFVDSSIVSEVTARNDGFISVQAIVD